MSSMTTAQQNGQPNSSLNQHLNGAALIDAEGREIPITEDMILAALSAMEQDDFLTTIRQHRAIYSS